MKNKNKIIVIGIILALVLVLIPIGEADEVAVDKQVVDVEPKNQTNTYIVIFGKEINITSNYEIWTGASRPYFWWWSKGPTSIYVNTWVGGISRQFNATKASGIMMWHKGKVNGSPPYYIRGTALLCLINC